MRLEKKDAINDEIVVKVKVPKFEINSGLNVFRANSNIYITKNEVVILIIELKEGSIVDSYKVL